MDIGYTVQKKFFCRMQCIGVVKCEICVITLSKFWINILMPSDLSRQLNLGHSVWNQQLFCNFPARPSLILLQFSQNRICINVLEHALQTFAAIFSVLVFGGILKTSGVTPFIAFCKSHLNLLPYSAINDSTNTTHNLIAFAGHLVMVVLIKGGVKNLVFEH